MQNQHTQGSHQEAMPAQELNIMWQTIGNNKRVRSNPEMLTSNKRQLNIKDYWLNKSISTSHSKKLNEIEN